MEVTKEKSQKSIAKPGGRIAAMQQKYFKSMEEKPTYAGPKGQRSMMHLGSGGLELGKVTNVSGEKCCICGTEYKHGRKMLFCADCNRAMCQDCDEHHVCTCVAEKTVQTTPRRGDAAEKVKSAPSPEKVKSVKEVKAAPPTEEKTAAPPAEEMKAAPSAKQLKNASSAVHVESSREVKAAPLAEEQKIAPSAVEVRAAPLAEELKSSLSAEQLKNAPPAADAEPPCVLNCVVAAAHQPLCETSFKNPGASNECTLPAAGTYNAQPPKIQAIVLPYGAAMISATRSINNNIMFL